MAIIGSIPAVVCETLPVRDISPDCLRLSGHTGTLSMLASSLPTQLTTLTNMFAEYVDPVVFETS